MKLDVGLINMLKCPNSKGSSLLISWRTKVLQGVFMILSISHHHETVSLYFGILDLKDQGAKFTAV